MKIRSWGLFISLTIGYSVFPISTPAKANIYASNLRFHLDASNATSYSGSGNNWNDISGQNNHFALSATRPTFNNSAPKNFQLTKTSSGGTFFSGNNSWLGGQNFTVSAWIKTTNVGSGENHWTQMHIMSAESGGLADDWGFGVNGNGKLSFGTGGASDLTYASTSSVNSGNWEFVTATRTYSSGVIKIYVNGSLQTTSSSTVNANRTLTSNTSLKIGAGDDGGATFGGNIGAVYGYNTVLTDAQVLQNYNATMATYGYSPPTPANSLAPAISGTTTFGQVLTTTTGTWSNSPTYAYQWSRAATSGGSYTNISGANSSTYTLVAADVGQFLKSTVTATNGSGSASSTSSATAQIAKATPTFSSWSNVVKTFGDANYTVTAPTVTGSLSGSFSYGSSNSAVISVSGTTFTVAGGGSATITATFTPTDSASYNTAITTNTVTVNKAAQSAITITTTAATYGTNLTLASTGGSTGGTYTYTKVSGNCTLSGAVLTPTATGSCVIQSNLATTSNYLAAISTATTITIASGSVSASLTLAPGNFTFRQAKNITAVATVAGTITFRAAGKVLPGCIKKAVNAGNSFTAICSYRPTNHSLVTISATLNPTDSFYVGTVTNSAQYPVTRRTGTR
jgi:hypothetical protein